jgi:hypothetical protein
MNDLKKPKQYLWDDHMVHADRLESSDALVAHPDTVVPGLADPILQGKYVGFLCVSLVTVFELSIKDVLVGFARKKHRTFGVYCGNLFERMNGRISLKDLTQVHIKNFGQRYVDRFTEKVNKREAELLNASRFSVKARYGNVVVWRNSFAHEGLLPANANYDETKAGYLAGKEILTCLAESMVR